MTVTKFFNYVMFVLFIFAVAVQYNDPDPVRWMAIYGLAAIGCILWIRGKEARIYYFSVAGIALIWAIFLLIEHGHQPFLLKEMFSSFEMKNANVEMLREIGGLLIVAGWMIFLGFRSKSSVSISASSASL